MNRQRLLTKTLIGIGVACVVVLVIKTGLLESAVRTLEWAVQPLHAIRVDIFLPKNEQSASVTEGVAPQPTPTAADDQTFTERVELYSLRQQIVALKQELDVTSDWQRQTIHAEVIGRDTLLPAASVIINKGTLDGLARGWLVTAQGTLVGTVIQTNMRTSSVRLLNHPESNVAARLASQPTFLGVASGNPDLAVTLELIPQSVTVPDTDIVMTAPIGPYAETDIPLGSISRGSGEPEGLFQKLHVIPLVDYRTIRVVTIIIPEGLTPG